MSPGYNRLVAGSESPKSSETVLQIQARDGKTIHGRLCQSSGPNLVIIAHGLTGNMNEHMNLNGARMFQANGFSTFRFDFYSSLDNGRLMNDCSLEIHANDLCDVLSYFRAQMPQAKIAVIGHSLGAVVASLAWNAELVGGVYDNAESRIDVNNWAGASELTGGSKATSIPKFDAFISWDGTHAEYSTIMKDAKIDPTNSHYVWYTEINIEIARGIVDQLCSLDCNGLIKAMTIPKLFISASEENSVDRSNTYFEHALEPKQLKVIPDSDHCFTFGGNDELLFSTTLEFLNKHLG